MTNRIADQFAFMQNVTGLRHVKLELVKDKPICRFTVFSEPTDCDLRRMAAARGLPNVLVIESIITDAREIG